MSPVGLVTSATAPHLILSGEVDLSIASEPPRIRLTTGQIRRAWKARDRPRRRHVHRLERARGSHLRAQRGTAVRREPGPRPGEPGGRSVLRAGRRPGFVPGRMTPGRPGGRERRPVIRRARHGAPVPVRRRRWRRHDEGRLGADAARLSGDVAAEPPVDRARGPHLPVLDVDGVGSRAHVPLQRQVPPRHARDEVPVGARAGRPPRSGRRSGATSGPASRRSSRPASPAGTSPCSSSSSATATRRRPTTRSPTRPLSDESGAVAGLLCVVSEDTERVVGDRRMNVLRRLGAALDQRPDRGGGVRGRLRGARRPTRRCSRSLCSTSSTTGAPASRAAPARRPGDPVAPHEVPAGRGPVADQHRSSTAPHLLVDDLAERFSDVPTRRVGRAGDAPRCSSGWTDARGAALRRPGRRTQPVPAPRRGLPRIPRSRGEPDLGQPVQRPRLRGRAPAGGGPRRARPGQDRVLHQREPRVPDPAHPDPRADRPMP